MKKIAVKLTSMICENNPSFTELDIKKIQFGLECFLSDGSKMLIYFIFFSLLDLTIYYLIAVIFFVTLRVVAGGYHEETYTRCIVSSFILFLVMVFGGTMLILPLYIKATLVILSISLIYIYAPVDHPNMPIISETRRHYLKIKSIFTYIILLLISFLLIGKVGNTAFIALVVESIMLPLGYNKNKFRLN